MQSKIQRRAARLMLGALLATVLSGCGSDDYAKATGISVPAGIGIEELHYGTGPVPVAGQTATIAYTATLADGTKVDSTVDRGQNLSFRIGASQVIAGLESAVSSMRVGSHRRVTIPPDQAYGAEGLPPSIPPNATLIYDVWLSAVR